MAKTKISKAKKKLKTTEEVVIRMESRDSFWEMIIEMEKPTTMGSINGVPILAQENKGSFISMNIADAESYTYFTRWGPKGTKKPRTSAAKQSKDCYKLYALIRDKMTGYGGPRYALTSIETVLDEAQKAKITEQRKKDEEERAYMRMTRSPLFLG